MPESLRSRASFFVLRPMELFDRITSDPAVLSGKATIRGMRISVAQVVNMVANGMSTDEILLEYPFLEPDDVRQALRYVAALANEEIHSLLPVSS